MGTTEEKLAYLEETKEKLAQGLAAQGLTPAGTFRAMAEQVAEIPSGTPLPSLTNPGTAADLLSGKRLIDGTGRVVTGSMPDIVPQSMELESGQAYTIPRGYHSGSGIITAKGGAGGSFAVPLVVTVEAGATVTATNGADTVTGVSDGTCTLILSTSGIWTVSAILGGNTLGTFDFELPIKASINQGGLPDGYTELQYISNPNLTYMTAVGLPNLLFDGLKIEGKFGIKLGTTYLSFFGNYRNIGANMLYRKNDKTICLQIGESSYLSNKPVSDVFTFVVDLPKNIFAINDDTIEISGTSIAEAPAPSLFAYSRPTDPGYNPSDFNFYFMRCYSSTHENTGPLRFEYVPCLNPDGVAGLYETVNRKFYTTNEDGKPFVSGPTV